jgi:hypothetical protein
MKKSAVPQTVIHGAPGRHGAPVENNWFTQYALSVRLIFSEVINHSFNPLFHRGAAEGVWLAREVMDLNSLKTTGVYNF